jgi:hypothetical protein
MSEPYFEGNLSARVGIRPPPEAARQMPQFGFDPLFRFSGCPRSPLLPSPGGARRDRRRHAEPCGRAAWQLAQLERSSGADSAVGRPATDACAVSPRHTAGRPLSDRLTWLDNRFFERLRLNEETKMMKVVSSLLILGAMLAGCVTNEPPPARATTVVVPPSNATTTVVVPQNSGTTALCRDGTRPPCY